MCLVCVCVIGCGVVLLYEYLYTKGVSYLSSCYYIDTSNSVRMHHSLFLAIYLYPVCTWLVINDNIAIVYTGKHH